MGNEAAKLRRGGDGAFLRRRRRGQRREDEDRRGEGRWAPSPPVCALLSWGQGKPPPTAATYLATLGRVHAFRATLRAFIGTYDAIICPVAAGPAPLHGTPPAAVPPAEYVRYEANNHTHVYSLAGLPVAVVRISEDPHGMPIGVQLAARPFRDYVALAVARVSSRQSSPRSRHV